MNTTEQIWRIITDSRGDAAWNMAVDESLFRHSHSAGSLPVLRFYQWTPFSISIGRFQCISRTVNIAPIESLGVTLVRRITGGRGILHGDDLTVSMACNCSHLGLNNDASVIVIYEVVTSLISAAFARIGVPTTPGRPHPTGRTSTAGDCFRITSPSDLVHAETGEKVLGGALHKRADQILLQASVPLRSRDNRTQVQTVSSSIFQGADVGSITNGKIASEINRRLLTLAIANSLIALPVRTTSDVLSQSEHELASRLHRLKYSNDTWNMTGNMAVKG